MTLMIPAGQYYSELWKRLQSIQFLASSIT